jgi:predicted nucleic acid-binding protein
VTTYLLDTNVFNKLNDGQLQLDAFRDLDIVVTHIQWEELSATKNSARKAELLRTFEKINPKTDRTASALFDVSVFDQSAFAADGVVEGKMTARLSQLDAAAGKKHRDPKNRQRDVLIAHTAIKNNVTLISDDKNLRQLVCEFRGRAISTSLILAKNKTGR